MHVNVVVSPIHWIYVIAFVVVALLLLVNLTKSSFGNLFKHRNHIIFIIIEIISLLIASIIVGLWFCRLFGV